MLPELCVTEGMAMSLADWVRRPGGPRVLVAGSFHHGDRHGGGDDDASDQYRRNTALTWVRGHDEPLRHDKVSAADRPVVEDIQPQAWPGLGYAST